MTDQSYESSGPAVITLFRTAVSNGAVVEGVVSGLGGLCGPLRLRYLCHEAARKMYFPDQKEVAAAGRNMPAFCSRVVASAEVDLVPEQAFASFAFDAPADAPPNFIGVHDCMDHTLVYSCTHTVSVIAADGSACYGTATVNVVPEPARRSAAGAHDDEASHMDRDIRVLPRICWRDRALLTHKPAIFNVEVPGAHAARAGERLFLNLAAFTHVPPRSLKISIRRTMRLRLGATAATHLASPLLRAFVTCGAPPAAEAAEEAGGGAPREEAVALETTVQRFAVGRPFDTAFEGCFYVLVPPRCCTFASAMAEVSYELRVKLKFGLGRRMQHRIPLTVRHALHDAARQTGKGADVDWLAVCAALHARGGVPPECPICFEHFDADAADTPSPPAAEDAGAFAAAAAPTGGAAVQRNASTSEPALVTLLRRGGGGGAAAAASPAAPAAPEHAEAGGAEQAPAAVEATWSGAALARRLVGWPASGSEQGAVRSDEGGGDKNAACGACACEAGGVDSATPAGGASTSGGATSGASLAPSSPCSGAASLRQCSGSGALARPRMCHGSHVLASLGPDVAVTDCGHVFHTVCLLRYERHNMAAQRAASAAAGPAGASFACPVCRSEYCRRIAASASCSDLPHVEATAFQR